MFPDSDIAIINRISASVAVSFFFKVKVKEAQLCPTLCDPMAYTVHGIL